LFGGYTFALGGIEWRRKCRSTRRRARPTPTSGQDQHHHCEEDWGQQTAGLGHFGHFSRSRSCSLRTTCESTAELEDIKMGGIIFIGLDSSQFRIEFALSRGTRVKRPFLMNSTCCPVVVMLIERSRSDRAFVPMIHFPEITGAKWVRRSHEGFGRTPGAVGPQTRQTAKFTRRQ
jgi:hypothetical protein